jgi:hypothetical protein
VRRGARGVPLVFAGCGAIVTDASRDGVLGATGVAAVVGPVAGAALGAGAYQLVRTPQMA